MHQLPSIEPYFRAITLLWKASLSSPKCHNHFPNSASLNNLIFITANPPFWQGQHNLSYFTEWKLDFSCKPHHRKSHCNFSRRATSAGIGKRDFNSKASWNNMLSTINQLFKPWLELKTWNTQIMLTFTPNRKYAEWAVVKIDSTTYTIISKNKLYMWVLKNIITVTSLCIWKALHLLSSLLLNNSWPPRMASLSGVRII